MLDKPNQRGQQMTFRESDGRIVPTSSEVQSAGEKPSNIGAGKAARTSRDWDRAPSVLRDGTTALTRLDRSSLATIWWITGTHCLGTVTRTPTRIRSCCGLVCINGLRPSDVWEPDALTAHVRIYEGATSIVHGDNLVTPPQETRWQTGKTNRILNTRD